MHIVALPIPARVNIMQSIINYALYHVKYYNNNSNMMEWDQGDGLKYIWKQQKLIFQNHVMHRGDTDGWQFPIHQALTELKANSM